MGDNTGIQHVLISSLMILPPELWDTKFDLEMQQEHILEV